MNVSPVHIFPWQRPFLPDLKDFLERVSNGRPGTVLLIAPHNRPWRYLTRLYADAGHAGLLPRFMPLADVIAAWRARISSAPLHMAAELDRVALLHECVTRLARDDQRLAARFAHMDMARFLPWGLRLGNVFE
ncbi:MAG: PD-(D/E)XK nuclease family protein, partial [Desulfovibrio sp.]|nr:PD-(D/E)XK nuclease family protein [Desulfovibrio sp.]